VKARATVALLSMAVAATSGLKHGERSAQPRTHGGQCLLSDLNKQAHSHKLLTKLLNFSKEF